MEANEDVLDDFSDDSETNEQVPEEPAVCESEVKQPKPEYTVDDLSKLLDFLKRMVILTGLKESDWNDDCIETIKTWFWETSHPMLTIYFATNQRLTASLSYPTEPTFQIVYFMREPNHIFSLDNFHDDVTFGQINDDVDGSLLLLMEKLYAPMFFHKTDWNESNRERFLTALHTFLANMTALHYKLSGLTVLYVPSEGIDKNSETDVEDSGAIKRFEIVAEYWIDQLRLCVSDTEQVAPYELMCPSDEHDFWIYRYESLLAVRHQVNHKDFLRIVNILKKSQSVFVKPLEEFITLIETEIEKAKNNITFLKLLLEPCKELASAESPVDIPMKLARIIHIIRYIWLNSIHYNSSDSIIKLFRYVGNQIIKFCCEKINVAAIFTGQAQSQIKLADMSIDCCLYYKAIYEKIENHHDNWILNRSMVFNYVDAFIRRLYDFIEICEGIRIFGKQPDDAISLEFDGDRGAEFEKTCKNIETTFQNGLARISDVSASILNINDKSWAKHIRDFRLMTENLEEMIDNLMENVFTCVENLEEAVYAIACLYRFSVRDKLRKSFDRKVIVVWNMFAEELSITNDELVDECKERLSYLPEIAGRAILLKSNRNRLMRLKSILEKAEWLPDCMDTDKILSNYNKMITKMSKNIQKMFDEWIQSHGVEVVTKLNRLLLLRSLKNPGFFECNFDQSIFNLFKEAQFFKQLGFGFPVHLNQFFAKEIAIKTIYDAIIEMVASYNKILMSVSETERLLLRPLIQTCDKSIAYGAMKLTWASEGLDTYVGDCNKNIRELNAFISIYQRANANIVKNCEKICEIVVISIPNDQPHQLPEIENSFVDYLNEQIDKIAEHHKRIEEMVLIIYREFEIHVESVQELWTDYVLKIEKLIEEAITICSRRSLQLTFNTLHGDGIMAPNALVHTTIDILDKNLMFQPDAAQSTEFFESIYDKLCDAIAKCPRLIKKLELDISQPLVEYHEKIKSDRQCTEWQTKIRQEMIKNKYALEQYQEQWMPYAHIWQLDKDAVLAGFGADETSNAESFDKKVQELRGLFNKVTMRDISVKVHFMVVDAKKLQKIILLEIDDWKSEYLQLLKQKTFEKITEFFNYTKESGEKVLIVPQSVDELKKCISVHEHLWSEIDDGKSCLNDLRDQFGVLNKYGVPIDGELKEMKARMRQQWDDYFKKLNDAEEILNNAKDSFKLTLESERITPDFF